MFAAVSRQRFTAGHNYVCASCIRKLKYGFDAPSRLRSSAQLHTQEHNGTIAKGEYGDSAQVLDAAAASANILNEAVDEKAHGGSSQGESASDPTTKREAPVNSWLHMYQTQRMRDHSSTRIANGAANKSAQPPARVKTANKPGAVKSKRTGPGTAQISKKALKSKLNSLLDDATALEDLGTSPGIGKPADPVEFLKLHPKGATKLQKVKKPSKERTENKKKREEISQTPKPEKQTDPVKNVTKVAKSTSPSMAAVETSKTQKRRERMNTQMAREKFKKSKNNVRTEEQMEEKPEARIEDEEDNAIKQDDVPVQTSRSISHDTDQSMLGMCRRVPVKKLSSVIIRPTFHSPNWVDEWVNNVAPDSLGGSIYSRALIRRKIKENRIPESEISKYETGVWKVLSSGRARRKALANVFDGHPSEHVVENTVKEKTIRAVLPPLPLPAVKYNTTETPPSKSVKGKKTKVVDSKVRGIESVNAADLVLTPVQTGHLDVPKLSYGLERVLFNPGVYQLQDPRSRVFNFDPYLQEIMPVSEFDFTALKAYLTSSKDLRLMGMARKESSKYTGSTSSMTSALGHFHFLLSQWRPINPGVLSRDFPVEFESFTQLQRGPTAIFLRHVDGVYAIDADKEFDSANILSSLGKSMEKLLTLSTESFERYRKPNSSQITEEERNEEEAFHYTTMGDFLMRSQLDAHDPRLPGTGMFDLKTRAVVAIRMDTSQYEEGSGYEIRSRFGEWESYEREYYDMIRSAFLKYSLQVRMGRMDGIFVAYHNTERIFGFQYVSLPEMDHALHGTYDTSIGDSEFKLSVDMLNKVLNRATAKFPGKSLRMFFETRETATPFMYVFAQPVEREEIEEIQNANKAEIEEFEARVLGLASEDEQKSQAGWDGLHSDVELEMDMDAIDVGGHSGKNGAKETYHRSSHQHAAAERQGDGDDDKMVNIMGSDNTEEQDLDVMKDSSTESTASETDLTGQLTKGAEPSLLMDDRNVGTGSVSSTDTNNQKKLPTLSKDNAGTPLSVASKLAYKAIKDAMKPKLSAEVFAMTLTIRNKVNGEYVTRPEKLTSRDDWQVEYSIVEVEDQEKAKALYAASKARRSKVLNKTRADTKWSSAYTAKLLRMARHRREWRQKVERKEKLAPKVTL